MNFQIGILVLFVTCHLVKSDLLSILSTTEAAVDVKTLHHDTDVGNNNACILCNQNRAKQVERCTVKQLGKKCKTCHDNKCRCPDKESIESNVDICPDPASINPIYFVIGLIVIICCFICIIRL